MKTPRRANHDCVVPRVAAPPPEATRKKTHGAKSRNKSCEGQTFPAPRCNQPSTGLPLVMPPPRSALAMEPTFGRLELLWLLRWAVAACLASFSPLAANRPRKRRQVLPHVVKCRPLSPVARSVACVLGVVKVGWKARVHPP